MDPAAESAGFVPYTLASDASTTVLVPESSHANISDYVDRIEKGGRTLAQAIFGDLAPDALDPEFLELALADYMMLGSAIEHAVPGTPEFASLGPVYKRVIAAWNEALFRREDQ